MSHASTFFSPDTRGQQRLAPVFWIYGVLLSHVLFGSIILLYAQVSTPVLGAMLAGFLVYTAWIMRLVWINADNTDTPTYGAMARYLTVAWSINAVLVSLFMLLAHASHEPFPLPF